MIRTIKVNDAAKTAAMLARCRIFEDYKAIQGILYKVRKNGDKSVLEYEKKFNGVAPDSLRVSESDIKEAYKMTSKSQIESVKAARNILEKTEHAIKAAQSNITITTGKTKITKKMIPIQSVGCYVPGGLARYPSSAVMSVVPAKVAGVRRIVVVTPPGPDGKIDPLTAVAAKICGATEIYKTGGAQAIAALSFGTDSIPKVDKIVGPGGSFVTLAKDMVSKYTSIDMLAGPTELGIVADDSADPYHVALDLISQAEHSSDTQCYVITDSKKLARSINNNLSKLACKIKRKKIVRASLKKNGFIAVCSTTRQMAELANMLAPEHLQVMTRRPQDMASKITTPGMVLVGPHSPSAASDYLLGSNHILPTGGLGSTRGSLSMLDFVKMHTQVRASKSALAEISVHLRTLTDAEGLPNHYEAVRGRLQ